MGVSGCGKTTVGSLLAQKLDAPFYDADDFHPEENVQKMRSGNSLNDTDREPWLRLLANRIQTWSEKGEAVLACSALKHRYRNLLDPTRAAFWVYLQGDYDTIVQRLQQRTDHYMPPSLLKSQFDTLEVPENALHLAVTHSPEALVSTIVTQYSLYEKS